MERILCVWSPQWAIEGWKRRHPCASPAEGTPFALIAAERGVRRLTAVDSQAARLGLFVGQKATDAAALVPELASAEADPDADRAALTALCCWCARFSPAVAVDPPDGLSLDITGVAHLWGGESALMDDVLAQLAGGGISARAAIAGTVGAAWALARYGADRTIVPVGEEATFLAPLPVAALRLEPAAAAQIARLGVGAVGALMRLPRDQVTRRFGREAVQRLDQALGAVREAQVFLRPPTPWLARLAFAEPISAPEDLTRATLDIAQRLCARLEARGCGARRFELIFHRLDGVAPHLAIGLALAARDADRIARLFTPHLETIDPGFGIEVVTLAASETAPLEARQGALGAGDEADGAVAPLIDRLANRLGHERVWRAEAHPSHAPERAVRRRPPLSALQGETWDAERPRPLRLFRRPEPIEVVAPAPDDPPILFRWRGAPHRVRRAEGPERLAEEWWRRPFADADPSRARDYYRVEDEAGARFWLFRAGPYGGPEPPKWWMHGLG